MSRPDPLIGRTLRGSIVLESAIGDGGMGRVYKGIDTRLSRVVAVKVLRPDHKDVETARVYFEREARAASQLWHPNIIQIIDFGYEDDGTLYLVMEYVPGRNLADVLEQEFPLSTARIVRILAQLLTALEEAHRRGIVHRDLKPENIMLQDVPGNPDFVKVLDFGVAKAVGVDAAGPMTIQGLVMGTPHFMSPEQALGHEIDARSDLYSVGAILYQVLTCDLPFDGQLVMNVLARVITERPVPPRQRRPEFPIDPRLERICMRAMRKNVEGRFQTASEFRAALLELLEEEAAPPAQAPPALTLPPARSAVPLPPPPPAQTARSPFDELDELEGLDDLLAATGSADAAGHTSAEPNDLAPTPARASDAAGSTSPASPASPAERSSGISAPDLEPLRQRARNAVADSVYDLIDLTEINDIDSGAARHVTTCLAVHARPAVGDPATSLSSASQEAFQALFEREVRRLSGVVASRLGVASTALFGYPRPLDDDVQHAVTAALNLLHVVRDRMPEVSLGFGLAHGQIALPGNDLVAAWGRPIDQALALAAEAADQRILVDQSVREAPSAIDLVATGRDGVYEPDFDSEGAPAALFLRVRLPLLERAAQIDALERLIDRVHEGRPFSAAIVAPAGHGKTRLLGLMARDAERRRVAVLQIPAEPFPSAIPGTVLRRIVSTALELVPADRPRDALASLGVPPDLARVLRKLLSSQAPQEHAPFWIDALKAALYALLTALAARTPLLLSCDRFESIDPLSYAVLRHFTSRLPDGTRLGLVVAGNEDHPLTRGFAELHSTLHVPPLSPRAVESLVRDNLPDADRALVDDVVARAGGVPTRVALLIEHVRNRGVGRSSEPLPDDAMSVLARRLERLPENARKLLAIAGALGASFPLEALAGACPRSWNLRSTLQLVGRAGLLAIAEERSGVWLRFEPAALSTVALDQLLDETRRQIHLRIARYYERLREETPSPEYDFQWARQLGAAGQEAAGTRLLLRAAEGALEVWGPLGALPLLDATLDAAEATLWSSSDAFRQTMIRTAAVMVRGEDFAQALPLLRRLERSELPASLRARVHWLHGEALLGHKELEAADAQLERALAEVPAHDQLTQARIHLARALVFEARRELEAAITEARRASEALSRFDGELHGRDRELAWHPALLEARIRIFHRGYEQAAATLLTALREATRLNDERGLVRLDHALGFTYRSMGQPDDARLALDAAIEATRRCGDVRTRVRLLNDKAAICLESGSVDEAYALLSSALELARALGLRDVVRANEARLAQLRESEPFPND